MDFEKLKGTKTEENLKKAFAGESEARNKYTYFASKAKKEAEKPFQAFLPLLCYRSHSQI